MGEKLPPLQQDNVLTLLCYSEEAASIIRGSVTLDLFDSAMYRDIANVAIAYLDQYHKPIGDHLADELDHVLNSKDKRKASAYGEVLEMMHSTHDVMNPAYVVSQLHKFVHTQRLKQGILEAAEFVKRGESEEAEVVLEKAMRERALVFDPGTIFTDTKKVLKFFEQQIPVLHTGISALDEAGVGPGRGEMFLMIAPPKRGKTWGLIHLSKFALLQRQRVLHITLEMSEERIAQRYVQSFFSVSKRKAKVKAAFFQHADGRLLQIDYERLDRKSFEDEGTRAFIAQEIPRRFGKRSPLIIKQFPTRSLTINGLRAYLDSLERSELKFRPDVVTLDYADLMHVDAANLRTDLGRVFQDLRGMAVERNFALVTATQGNRESASAKIVTDAMVAEDWSKIATADNVLTFSQTESEREYGLARLFVSNGRNDEDKFSVCISQSYTIGQFCLDAMRMPTNYWTFVDKPEKVTDYAGEEPD